MNYIATYWGDEGAEKIVNLGSDPEKAKEHLMNLRAKATEAAQRWDGERGPHLFQIEAWEKENNYNAWHDEPYQWCLQSANDGEDYACCCQEVREEETVWTKFISPVKY